MRGPGVVRQSGVDMRSGRGDGPGGGAVYCGGTTVYCVQCGPRCYGGALCLSSPNVGSRPCPTTCWDDDRGGADDEEDFLPDLPPSTPASMMFDMCESDADVAAWTEDGGRPPGPITSPSPWSTMTGSACRIGSDCVETCYQLCVGFGGSRNLSLSTSVNSCKVASS